MLVIHLQFILTISFLSFAFMLMFKKYISSKFTKSEDFYMASSVLFMLCSHIAQYIAIATKTYDSSLIFMYHIMRVSSLWGVINFFMTQIYFKSKALFKIHKFFIFVGFIISIAIISSFSLMPSHQVFPPVFISVFHSSMTLPNRTSHLLFEILCLFFSTMLFIPMLKLKNFNLWFGFSGIVMASFSYIFSIISITKFMGNNKTLFFLSFSAGKLSTLFLALTVILYVLDNTKKEKEGL